MLRHKWILTAALLLLGATMIHAQDNNGVKSDGVAVTIYNQGTALVRDKRTFTLTEGTNLLNFTDVASGIDPTSVNFKSITDPQGTKVLEQNYVYDLVGSSALLERYLDQTIQVTTQDGTVYTGQLLSGRNSEIIMRTTEGQVQVISQYQARDIQFPALPEGLITRPTLRWLLTSAQGGSNQVELTYMTGGMNWTADYNVLLAPGNASLDLTGWVTLNNTSGTSYKDAQVKLIAGDVNRVQEQQPIMDEMVPMPTGGASTDGSVAQRDFNEYKLYEIGRPVTIGDNETKQVEFVSGTGIASNAFFVYDSSPSFYGYYDVVSDQYYGQTGVTTVQNYMEFTTGKDSGLDAALPAGRIRVFQQDVDGAALLIGENTINHTAKGEKISLYLGNAFDLVGERKQTDFKIITGDLIQETYEIRLRNRKDAGDVEIRVPERLFRWSNWEILSSSVPFEKKDSSTIEFRPTVKAGEEVVITYTVQYSWPR